MAKKPSSRPAKKKSDVDAYIAGAGLVAAQPIVETLQSNYMPYAMSVIISRAIPEIDGFKPSHRKLLYTMYSMGLLNNTRQKSANITGATMRLNPHGDQAIYDTMVRLSRGYEALLHPFVDSKGNFGKAFSRDMACAAPRYTEAKLDSICAELFKDINGDTVDFADNYDGTMREPTLLPVTFPTVLVNANTGIAVGMASSICSFNLMEVCETTIALIRDENHNLSDTLLAPDFAGGGRLIYDKEKLDTIYSTGRGGFRVRSVYSHDKSANCIDVTQIPPTTSIEAIVEKTIELIRAKKLTEISDIRDETGIDGLKITIDIKRGVDPDKLMNKLFKMTPLEDTFSCNFNVLIASSPQVLGVRELLQEWIAFRLLCVQRRIHYNLGRAEERLHLLEGLGKILLDIDKCIKIVRETDEESEVVPNLMIGFGIDEVQAEYVAEIKLRHLNREYILKRLKDIEQLKADIEEMRELLSSKAKQKGIIIDELKNVIKLYGHDRKTEIYYPTAEDNEAITIEVPDYPVHLFFTKEGYFKKITPQSLRMSGEQKLKEGDEIYMTLESSNVAELLFFTDRQQVYKCRAHDFDDTKASVLGDYIPSKLQMDEGESAVYMAVTSDYSGFMLFAFKSGKIAKVDMASYKTLTNRKKLLKAYSGKDELIAIMYLTQDCELHLTSTDGRVLLVSTAMLSLKTTKDTAGVAAMTMRKGKSLSEMKIFAEGSLERAHRYRSRALPAAGKILSADDAGEQLELLS